jgi:ATP-dependent Clp protease ATP-binding subunit ClpX
MELMLDHPGREDVVEVKVTEACITNGTQPLLEISPIRRKKEA